MIMLAVGEVEDSIFKKRKDGAALITKHLTQNHGESYPTCFPDEEPGKSV